MCRSATRRFDGWGFTALVDEVRRHLDIAHIDERAPLRRLSGGEQARVMLAGVLLARPTVLLLDEPTNHLDLAGLRWLETYLNGFSGAVLIVSHDRRFLDNTVGRIFELDGTSDRMQTYDGGYTAYRAEKLRRWQRLLEEHRAQERYRRRLETDIARTRQQALGVERTASGAGSDRIKRYAKKVAAKAKARERRLRRQMEAAEWIGDPTQGAQLHALARRGVGRRAAAGGARGRERPPRRAARAGRGRSGGARSRPHRRHRGQRRGQDDAPAPDRRRAGAGRRPGRARSRRRASCPRITTACRSSGPCSSSTAPG